MKIRAAKNSDLDTITALLRLEALPTSDVTGSLLRQFLVAEEVDGTLAGCVGLELFGPVALLRSLTVANFARSTGLGHRSVSRAEHAAEEAGVSELWLLTTTAASFFLSIGYALAERAGAPKQVQGSSQFVQLCPASAMCLTKTLVVEHKAKSR